MGNILSYSYFTQCVRKHNLNVQKQKPLAAKPLINVNSDDEETNEEIIYNRRAIGAARNNYEMMEVNYW